MTLLSTYEVQVADLLHDLNNTKWTIPQLDRYINEARRKLVKDTGCLRTLQQAFVTQAQEAYTFGQITGGVINAGGANYTAPTIAFSGGGGGSGVAATLGVSGGAVNAINFTNFGSGYTSVPSYLITDATGSGASLSFGILSANTFDILNTSIVWGSQRYSLEWRAFRILSALMRQWLAASYTRQPVMWATYGQSQTYLGPPPDQSYPVEWDTIILPTDLADYVTNDPIPIVMQDSIKFYAAHTAKFNSQSFGEAESFLGQYRNKMLEDCAAYTGRIPNIYAAAAG
jgi:hypothetical protein